MAAIMPQSKEKEEGRSQDKSSGQGGFGGEGGLVRRQVWLMVRPKPTQLQSKPLPAVLVQLIFHATLFPTTITSPEIDLTCKHTTELLSPIIYLDASAPWFPEEKDDLDEIGSPRRIRSLSRHVKLTTPSS